VKRPAKPVTPRRHRGKHTDRGTLVNEDEKREQTAERGERRRAERAAHEAGLIQYLRKRDRRVFDAVTTIIRESRRAPGMLPALAVLVDYITIQARRDALHKARREVLHLHTGKAPR